MGTLKKAHIIRLSESTKVTLGVFIMDGLPRFFTLEEPWRQNQSNSSCIPEGEYKCEEYMSSKFGNTFVVMNVPGRSGILFHTGNSTEDTEGCILLGMRMDPFSWTKIADSRNAFEFFRSFLMGEKEFQLRITRG